MKTIKRIFNLILFLAVGVLTPIFLTHVLNQAGLSISLPVVNGLIIVGLLFLLLKLERDDNKRNSRIITIQQSHLDYKNKLIDRQREVIEDQRERIIEEQLKTITQYDTEDEEWNNFIKELEEGTRIRPAGKTS